MLQNAISSRTEGERKSDAQYTLKHGLVREVLNHTRTLSRSKRNNNANNTRFRF